MNRLSSNIGKYISFAEFIEGLTVNGIDWDLHYMSLTQLLRPDVVKYDCLLRLRTLGCRLSEVTRHNGRTWDLHKRFPNDCQS